MSFGNAGIVDLPCGSDPNAFDWTLMGSNGFEGVSVLDALPHASGGLKVYVAFQRPLTGEGMNTRIGQYDVDTDTWSFYYYTLDADVGGVSGNTFLSELVHVAGDRFAVIERDQGVSFGALNKSIRAFTLASGTLGNAESPVDKELAIDLLALSDSFRMDQEKIEGLALGGGSLFVVNDNDGGQAQNFFMRFSPQLLGAGSSPPEAVPAVVVSEVNSNAAPADFVELHNTGTAPANVSGWTVVDSGGGVYTIPPNTTIAPDSYLLITALGFGLGGADSVELSTSLGTPVDAFAWTAHVASASRCGSTGLVFWPTTGTNGSGAPTPGAANACTGPTVTGQSDVVVNEINSSGNDFVELYNKGAIEVDLAHWKVRDSDPTHSYVLPAGTKIAAGGYLVVEGDWTTAPPALPFGLGQGDSVVLSTPYDAEVQNLTWVGHAQTASRCPNGSGALVNPTNASKGLANVCN